MIQDQGTELIVIALLVDDLFYASSFLALQSLLKLSPSRDFYIKLFGMLDYASAGTKTRKLFQLTKS